MPGKFINDKICFWNLVVLFVFSRVRVRVRGELASNFQGRFRFCTIGRRLVIQANDSGMRKCRLQASAELASPQEPRGNIQKIAHWLKSKTFPSLLEIPLSFLPNSILQSTSQKL
jgi:hypothetical protein